MKMKRWTSLLLASILLLSVISLLPMREVRAEEEGELKHLRILGPIGETGKFRFDDRERYSIWPEFVKLTNEYGLDLEYEAVASSQYADTIKTRMATSTDLPDFANVTRLGQATILDMANKGLVPDLNPIVDEYSDGTAKAFFGEGGLGERSWLLNTTEDGEVYWISQIQATTYDDKPGSTNILAQIRADWLEKVGREMPTTTEELHETLKAFQEEDVNENGEADEIISIDFSGFNSNGFAEWFGLVYGLVGFNLIDGEPTDVTSPWKQEGIKDYFTYLNELYEDGLIDAAVIGSTEPNQNIELNKAAVVSNYTLATWNEPLVVGVDDAMYEPIYPLDSGHGYESILAIEPPFLSYNNWVFTSEATDNEANARLIDMLCSDRYIELTQWGLEGETYEVVDGEKHFLPIALHDAYDEAYEAGIVRGDFLWGNGTMFPKRRFVPMENEIGLVRENFPLKSDFQERVMDYPYTTPLGPDNYLPVATNEQTERELELSTDLTTRSQEIASELIFGDRSVEEMDDIVAELDELGLQELIDIMQARLDRAKDLGLFS